MGSFEDLRNAKQNDLQRQAEEKQRINNPDFWRKLLEDHEAAIRMWQASVFPTALQDLQSLVKNGILYGRSLTISPFNMIAHRDNPSRYREQYGIFHSQLTKKSNNDDEKLINGVTVGATVTWDPYERNEAQTETSMRIATYKKKFAIYVSKNSNGVISNCSTYRIRGEELHGGETWTKDLLDVKYTGKTEFIAIPNWQSTPKDKAEAILLAAFKNPYVTLSDSNTVTGDFRYRGESSGPGSL